MNGLFQDVRYAVRLLARRPSFTVVAVLTLALGIGATTAIFSVIDNVLMEPFPYADASRLAYLSIHDTAQGQSGDRAGYGSAEFLDYAEQNHVFDRVIGTAEEEVLYRRGEGTERFYGARITPGSFELFGVPALHGRVIQAADYEPRAPSVFVIRYKAWVERFGGDLGVLNETFILNGTPRTLVGIMPPRFGWYEADVLIPDKPVRVATSGGMQPSWFLLGHLKPGVSLREADADLGVVASRLAKVYPNDYPTRFSVRVDSLVDVVVGQFRSTLYLVLAGVALLLLIACANVANLMLARATAREKEFALRAALGAGRSRLVRQLLVESALLALGGAAFGTLIAWGGLKYLVAAMPQATIPTEAVIQLNAPVLVFALAVAGLTALMFGLAPAVQVARRDLNDPLRDGGKGVGGGFRHRRLRDAVVVMEVALSLTLLAGAGLLMRSFVALRATQLGLRPDHVLAVSLPLPQDRYGTAEQVAGFFRPLLARLRALPGVVEAAEASALPPYGGLPSEVEVRGKTHSEKWMALFQLCSEGYFRVLHVEFKDGRPFTEAEVNGVRRVAVVNQKFVRQFLGNESPIGQRIRLAQLAALPDPVADPSFEIIGVVGDVKNHGLQEPIDPEVWVPHTVTGSGARSVLIRTTQEPLSSANSVRQAIWATDPGVALSFSGTLDSYVDSRSYAGPRFALLLMAIFGSVGLVLVTVGVYSVLAYSTARRTHEIGIRMALGARSSDVVLLVMKSGLWLVAQGVAIGLLASLGLGRVIASQLWSISASDPITLAAVAVLLLATGVAASWLPARRATRVEPTVALRYE